MKIRIMLWVCLALIFGIIIGIGYIVCIKPPVPPIPVKQHGVIIEEDGRELQKLKQTVRREL
jgi:uncharacterized protein (UPF0254 family)